MNEAYEEKQKTVVKETLDEKMSKIHHEKTFKNMFNMVALYFSHGLFNHSKGQF